MRKFPLLAFQLLAALFLSAPALAATEVDETKLQFGCINGAPALKTIVEFGVNRVEIGLWGNTLANLQNGQKFEISAKRPKETSLNLCIFDSPCLLVEGRILILDYKPNQLLKAVVSWAADPTAPPVVLPFTAELRKDEVAPASCSPAASPTGAQ